MAVSDANTNESDKSAKDSQKIKDKKEKPLTKIVVRRLPPAMVKESFLDQVSPIPDYDYFYMVKGDLSLGENAYSRVYINFVNATDIFMFKEKFDNYVFVDQKGHEYPAVVEFAAFQKIPRKRKPRSDPKSATIEADPYYLEFVESLKEQPNQDIKPEFSYQFTNESKDEVVSTPLLDYIKQRRIDKQRIREERREERRRKELERKKIRDDDRKKHEQKSPNKSVIKTINFRSSNRTGFDREEANEKLESKVKTDDEKEDSIPEKNTFISGGSKDYKYDDRKSHTKPKPRFPPRPEKSDYLYKKSEYKSRRDDYHEKDYRSHRYDDIKKEIDTKQMPRRTKKYSEKREERKNEAKKAEQRKIEEENNEKFNNQVDPSLEEDNKNITENLDDKINKCESTNETNDVIDSKECTNDDEQFENKLKHQISFEDESVFDQKSDESQFKENDPRVQRRIRNKDRPTMAIYQPGMLSKRRQTDSNDTGSTKE